MVNLAASRGRRLAFFDVVAAFIHALIDELVILLLPSGLGQGVTPVLYKALRHSQGFQVAAALFARRASCRLESVGDLRVNVHTDDKRATLGCWSDDLMVEADEEDLMLLVWKMTPLEGAVVWRKFQLWMDNRRRHRSDVVSMRRLSYDDAWLTEFAADRVHGNAGTFQAMSVVWRKRVGQKIMFFL